jgi:hypothetical protein
MIAAPASRSLKIGEVGFGSFSDLADTLLRMIGIPKSPLSDRIFATHAGPEQAAGWWMNEVRMGERLCKNTWLGARRLLAPATER